MPENEKKLILIRHADRDTSNMMSDAGLTQKGKDQAKLLLQYYRKCFSKPAPQLLSSSKRRCQETLEPLAKGLEQSIHIDPLLVEQRLNENFSDLVDRTDEFLKQWQQSDAELIIACSHGDWIPVFIHRVSGQAIDLSKGGWVELGMKNNKPNLIEIIQSFKGLVN